MDWKKTGALGASLLIAAGAGIGGGFILDQPTQIDVAALQLAAYADGADSIALPDVAALEAAAFDNGVASVEAPDAEVVYVDNDNYDLLLNEIYDTDGQVQYLTEDLDDDELDQMVERIAFANEIKSLAVAEVKAELADELDHTDIILGDNSTYEFDENDFEKIRVDDDADELELSNVDYEDGDADVIVTGRFRHDDKWFDFEAEVEFEDSKVEGFEVISVSEE